MAKQRALIGIDLDDVLARSADGFAAYSNEHWGTGHKAEDYTEDWSTFWGIPMDKAVQRATEMTASGVFGRYAPSKQALPVLQKLSLHNDLVVITSRPVAIKPETDTWVEEHFPDIFRNVYYVGIWDTHRHPLHKLTLTKAELCRELGIDCLIDDQLKHCVATAQAGITALLFGAYKWNQSDRLPEGVVRVADWDSVQQYFDDRRT